MGCEHPREGKARLSEVRMRSVGIDLHKRSMTVCVIDQTTGETFIRSFLCKNEGQILAFFQSLQPFEAVVEATSTYEWLWVMLEPFAKRLVLAHPKKLRIIAESKKKTDRFDARALATLLAQDEVPEAYRPGPQQREYQHLVRHRVSLIRQRSRCRVQVRSLLASRNKDFADAFLVPKDRFAELGLSPAETFRVLELLELLERLGERILAAEKALKEFRRALPEAQKKNHAIVKSVPGAGDIVADIVLSTLGPVDRFRSVDRVASYAGLVPGVRESDRRRKELPITKEGPRILRWALIEAGWVAVRTSRRWKDIFDELAHRRGRKKAIVAVARRLLVVIFVLLRKSELYTEEASAKPQGLALQTS
jgi:transposase